MLRHHHTQYRNNALKGEYTAQLSSYPIALHAIHVQFLHKVFTGLLQISVLCE